MFNDLCRLRSTSVVGFVISVSLMHLSCSNDPSPESSGFPTSYDYGDYYGADNITFLDELKTNTDVSEDLLNLTFINVEGNQSRPADYAGGRNVVLVITRGNTDPICPYCSTQTSRLIANYADFQARNAEVIVAYPVEHHDDAARLDAFLEASRNRLDDPSQQVPFPVLIDVELKAVDRLGIRQNLSKPATYILDSDGKVRFAYVGASLDDRPSIKAMLAELDKLAAGAPPAAS